MKYTLLLSPNVDNATRIQMYELCKDGESMFEAFCEAVENDPKMMQELAQVIGVMENAANLMRMNKQKFRPIGTDLECKVYEAKTHHLRVYMFEEEHTGRIIVLGGLKKTQKKDIRKTVATIEEYQNERT